MPLPILKTSQGLVPIAMYPVIPITIEGIPVNTSLKSLRKYANFLLELEYSERNTPAKTPTGAPIKEANPTTIKVPWMAGPIPPSPEPIEPGG